MKKYELTSETKTIFGKKLYRIRALVDVGNTVKAGDLGGYIESEYNLSQDGNAWVYGDARVYDNARVCGDAQVFGDASIYWISNIGSRNDTTTFFRTKDGISVACGCYFGTIDAFAEAVDKTHGDNQHGQVYRLAIEIAKTKIKE